MQTKIIKGKTISDEDRIYTFKLIDTENGTKLFHELVPILIEIIPDVKESILKFKDTGEIDVNLLELAKLIPNVLPWPRMKEVAKLLLAGSSVSIDGKTNEVGESGFGDYAQGDPMEVYTSFFYALVANYEKYLGPLFEAGKSEDTSPAKQ